ncbi:MAG: DUF4340 domain-containing protein [bacterium]
MTTQKLVTLTAVAAVLAGLAYYSNTSRKVKTPTHSGKPVLTGFDLSDVSKIEAGGSGAKKLVLEGSDTGWIIKSLFGYPADITKIRENLLALKDLKIGHVASGKKLDNAALVDLQNAAGKSLAALRLGEKHMRQPSGEMEQFGGGGYPDGRYVSAAGADTVFLVKETLDAFDGDPKNWADTQIVSLPAADISSIELAAKGQTVKLAKKDGNWTLDGLTEKEEFDTSKGYGVESALGPLSFTTVADPALTDDQLGITTGAVYTVTLKTGERYTAKIGNTFEAGTDRTCKLSGSFSPVGTNAAENAALAKKIEACNAKAGKWTYVIPSYNADNMTKSRADLVKPKEEPKKDETKEPTGADAIRP